MRFRCLVKARGVDENGDIVTDTALETAARELKAKCPYPIREPVKGTMHDAFVTARGLEVIAELDEGPPQPESFSMGYSTRSTR